jgi:lipopolysaccharide/colanic/teichoic acid biosynthesis glycosyltransferase
MYRKNANGWLKHIDFMILDMICLQLAFIMAYFIKNGNIHLYNNFLYRNMAIIIELADLMVLLIFGTLKGVLKRGHYQEFVKTLKHALIVCFLAVLYLFTVQKGVFFSRFILFLTIGIYFILTYIVRELWKRNIKKGVNSGKRRKLLIVTSSTIADKVIDNIEKNNYSRYDIVGVALLDKDLIGNRINNVSVVANNETVGMYACKEWVDEVLIVLSKEIAYPNTLIEQLTLAGITVHMNLAKVVNSPGKKQFVEKIGDYTVLTTSINYASLNELFLKRVFDIICGALGCILTLVICIFIGPAIYIASPGPIFFSQERVGKNGKKFKMYKFRSMYLDAEERKAELMKHNKLGDGKMFKLDFDPRVIGNKVMPDGSHKTGVGEFIRKTSLDEFPQFFNVLKGVSGIIEPTKKRLDFTGFSLA